MKPMCSRQWGSCFGCWSESSNPPFQEGLQPSPSIKVVPLLSAPCVLRSPLNSANRGQISEDPVGIKVRRKDSPVNKWCWVTSDPHITPEPRTPHEEVTQVDSYLLDVRHVGRVFVVGTILILHLHSNDGSSVLVLGKENNQKLSVQWEPY